LALLSLAVLFAGCVTLAVFKSILGSGVGVDNVVGMLWPIQLFGGVLFALVLSWVLLLFDGLVTLTVSAFVLFVHSVLFFLRWILWRLADFPKGASAAVAVLMGIVLAILRYVYKV
jgi:hypothetical protein